MALISEETKPVNKANAGTNSHKTERREKPATKVIVRRLPPRIDQESFVNVVSPLPDYDYLYLVGGDASLGENSFARVYINFIKSEDVYEFKEKFDNYVFLDSKGNEYPVVVEFASFQKTPKKRKARIDPKCGTIESDTLYVEFIDNLNKQPPLEQEEKPEYSYQLTTENKNNQTTPLLEFVKNRRVERMRIREERREERRRKELERKKLRDDERKKRFEKSPIKPMVKPTISNLIDTTGSDTELKEKESAEKSDTRSEKPFEKSSGGYYKNRDRKFEDKKEYKSKYESKYLPRKEFPEKREYKSKKDYYKDQKTDDFKKDTEVKQFPKKVKKYSEKREERKLEVQRLEQRRSEEQSKDVEGSLKSSIKNLECDILDAIKPIAEDRKDTEEGSLETNSENIPLNVKNDQEHCFETNRDSTFNNSKSSDSKNKERIRNKDRPTIAIYRPGMLSRRKLTDGDNDIKDSK